MKKILSIALALCLALALVSCGKGGTSSSSESSTQGFVKPEQYASVLLITINPQFRLYLDENGTVLAVEAVNKDAESIKDSISFENQNFETVIEAIVTEANKSGFVKADATINFEIVESKEADTAKTDILDKAEKKATDIANELKINVNINVSEIKPTNDPSSSETESTDNPSSSEPSHTHSFSDATCTEPKKCSCGAVEGSALGHDYKDGVCTRCKAKDPDFKPTSVLQKQGKWTLQYLNEKKLYSVTIIVCKSGENSASVGIGALLSAEMPNDPNCQEFGGEYYYFGMGSGGPIETVTEENDTVTLTDPSGNKLVLTRTGENTLKCTSAPDKFEGIGNIPVGVEFTFVAE